MTFLPAAALVPIGILDSVDGVQPYQFQYDHVIGTSLDLVVWSGNPNAALLAEIQRLASILNTRNPKSEIALLGESDALSRSRELREVFAAYAKWERQTQGSLSIRPAGPDSPGNVEDRAVAAARISRLYMATPILIQQRTSYTHTYTHMLAVSEREASEVLERTIWGDLDLFVTLFAPRTTGSKQGIVN